MPFNWEVELLRLTLFSSEAISLTEGNWKSITGQDEAENRNAIAAGGKQYSGKWSGGTFSMGYLANRADFILSYDQQSAEQSGEFVPSIGKWEQLSKTFETASKTIIEGSNFPVVRMAFGAVLLLPAEGRGGAYAALSELLRSVKVSPESKELSFRINWPRSSAVIRGLELNRITAWSTVQLTRTILQTAAGDFGVAPSADEHHFARLEIDHNTSQARKSPFEKAEKVPIFMELLELARENAATGECK